MRFFGRTKKKVCGICKGDVKKDTEGDVHQLCINAIYGELAEIEPTKEPPEGTVAYYERKIRELEREIADDMVNRENERNRLEEDISFLEGKVLGLEARGEENELKLKAFGFLKNWEGVEYKKIAEDITGFLHLRGINVNLSATTIKYSRTKVEEVTLISIIGMDSKRHIIVRITNLFDG